VIVSAIKAGFKAIERVDRALCLLPPYRLGRDLVLDSILGPAEDFEYVSKTAPRVPPQTIS
jgi:hypothetical protein